MGWLASGCSLAGRWCYMFVGKCQRKVGGHVGWPPGGGTDPKIARGGSAQGKKLDPTGSARRKNGGQKDLVMTKIRGQKDLWNIQLEQTYFLWTLPKLGVKKICAKF